MDIKPSLFDNFVAKNAGLIPSMSLTKGNKESQMPKNIAIPNKPTLEYNSSDSNFQHKSPDDFAVEPLQCSMSPHPPSPIVGEVSQAHGFE